MNCLSLFFMLIYCSIMSIVTLLIKILQVNYHITQLMFIYNLIICTISLIVDKFSTRFFIKTDNITYHFFRSIFAFTAFWLFCYACSHIHIGKVKAIMSLDPIVTSILAVYFYRESITVNKLFALFVALIGSMFIFNPKNLEFSTYSLSALISVGCYGIYNNITKKITKGCILEQRLYLSFFSAAYCLFPAIFSWSPISCLDLEILVCIAFLLFIASFSMFLAFKRADLSFLMPIHFIGTVITSVLGLIVLDEELNYWTVLGSIIIILGTVPIFMSNKRTS